MFDLLGVGADVMSGGAVGFLGSLLSGIVGYVRQRLDHQQGMRDRVLDHKHQLEMLEAEAKHRTQGMQIEQEGMVAVAEYEAVAASYQADAQPVGDSRLLLVAEFIRRMTRPVLTFSLLGLTAWVYVQSDGELQDAVARGVVALTATVVAWWFADRAISKQIAGRVL